MRTRKPTPAERAARREMDRLEEIEKAARGVARAARDKALMRAGLQPGLPFQMRSWRGLGVPVWRNNPHLSEAELEAQNAAAPVGYTTINPPPADPQQAAPQEQAA